MVMHNIRLSDLFKFLEDYILIIRPVIAITITHFTFGIICIYNTGPIFMAKIAIIAMITFYALIPLTFVLEYFSNLAFHVVHF